MRLILKQAALCLSNFITFWFGISVDDLLIATTGFLFYINAFLWYTVTFVTLGIHITFLNKVGPHMNT